MRFGIGYDVHKLIENRKLILGGVEIPFEKGLDGHSDADVLCHTIADALLGAAALGDIGKHFPDTDQHFKGISSLLLLKNVSDLLHQYRYLINNVDVTLIMEKPKIISYVDLMRQNIAQSLSISIDKISIKATTNEGLGFIGKGEGAAAMAIASISETEEEL
ncbi:MAG: 2-C-methyl-D-erythritol 2,4-cyclodiphosphate synthase [Ignavibacteriae bacterium]|nr:2-C-methyl-D-erythritol 2,4-cyclodiphosphate synthase [Ignavibacteriota bacterium]